MENMDTLAQLKDIHLPDAVGLWPLAWGWWVLLILLVLVALTAFLMHRRHRQRNRYRAAALAELQRATLSVKAGAVNQDQQVATYLQQLSIILRRAALSGCGNSYQANLKGEDWLRWLDDQCPEARGGFSSGAGRALLTGPYEANPQADIDALQQLVSLWLQKHRNQWQKTPVRKTAAKTLLPTRAQPEAPVDNQPADKHPVNNKETRNA